MLCNCTLPYTECYYLLPVKEVTLNERTEILIFNQKIWCMSSAITLLNALMCVGLTSSTLGPSFSNNECASCAFFWNKITLSLISFICDLHFLSNSPDKCNLWSGDYQKQQVWRLMFLWYPGQFKSDLEFSFHLISFLINITRTSVIFAQSCHGMGQMFTYRGRIPWEDCLVWNT